MNSPASDKLAVASADIGELIRELAVLLKDRVLTISTAESCTGGLLAELLTDISGSSEYFLAGVVAYSNAAKSAFLGVPPALIESCGAVSAEVAAAMAQGILRSTGSDLAIAVTGIAGPNGGTPEKPVGTVYLGFADCSGCRTRLLNLSGDRHQIRLLSAANAVDWILGHLSAVSHDRKR
jgi:nicotinamide-nucleotide amidase